MAHIRRHTRNPSPPPRPIPLLPDAIRFQPPPSRLARRTQSFQGNGLLPYAGSPIRATQQQLSTNRSLSRSSQPGVFYNATNIKYDPLTDLLTNPVNTDTNENYEQPFIISSARNQITPRERRLPPPSSSYSLQQYEQARLNNYETEESVAIPTLSNDDGLPVVSLEKTHVPVFARFPFDVTFIPRPMDTNVEDNIHKLRLRLIDSELNYQRQSTNDYLKRTHRIGMENDPQNTMDIARELEIRQIQDSLASGRRSNQQLMISNYSYDPRLHLQPVQEERQYSSSNMDDLIDAMARRHLASRRLDAAIEHQRRSGVGYGSYFESPVLGRRASLRSPQRTENLFLTNTTSSNLIEPDFIRTNPNDYNPMLRSRSDYYNRTRPDTNGLSTSNIIRTSSYSKLPPISPGIDSNRLSRTHMPSNSALYQARYNSQGHRNYQHSLPLNFPDQSEHLIELPSDIFLTSRAEPISSSQHHRQSRKSKARPISKDKSDVSADSDYDQSDHENKSPVVNRRKSKQEKHSANNDHGFFTEEIPMKMKPRRNLFKKAAIGIYFIHLLKHRAAKSRSTRPSQSLSATIHKIRLQEIMVALHRVYLEPDGPIYNALIQTITNSIELKDALNPSSQYYPEAIHVIGEALKNIVSKIVDFMPRDGVLGTAKNSAVAALIQDGNPFPENYFWQCEKELLEFHKTKIINITKQRATLLLIGVFIFRALVTTLLMKPIKYRLILGQLSTIQTDSLKVLASVIFYVGRRTAKSIPQILTLPHEWKFSLYSDADIEPIIEHSEIKSIITTCELSLRVWCEEYIRRIDGSFGRDLRT